jgi:gliding motility-associated-like protein
VTYSWSFGSGAVPSMSAAQNPSSIIYSTPGTKTITLNVKNQFGCTTSSTQTITINTTPLASFTSTAPQCTGLPVNFTNTGTTTAVTYTWNFGSGATPATSTVQNPAGVVYSTAGTKTIKLYTGNGTCTDSSIQTITIHQTPAVSFSSTAPQCAGLGVNFTNTGSTGTNWSYSWTFGQNALPASSSSQNQTGIVYSTGGIKQITLTISDGFCTKTDTQTITINATPLANFTSTAPQCTGLPVNFTNTGTTTAVTYTWNFGSGATPATSTVQNPAGVVYSTAGTKTIKLYTSNGTCTDSSIQTITIHQTPAVSFSSTAPQCAGLGVNFTNTGSTGTNWSYSWTFGQNALPASSSSQNQTGIVYSTGGIKQITLTISDGFCTKTDTQTITINATPLANFTSTAPQCTGLPVNFTNTGTTTAVTYTWNFGSGATPATSTVQNPAGVVYSTAGTKTIKLYTSNGTCTDSSIQTITIHQTPAVSFSSTAPQCAGVGVNFTNTGSTGTNWSYSWTFGQNALPASSTSQNQTGIVYSTGGIKQITLTISDGFCTKTDTQTIQIKSLPIANAGKDTTICANTSVMIGTAAIAGNTYNWFPASTLNSASVATPTASPIAPVTLYIVTVTNTVSTCVNTDSVKVTMLSPLLANAGVDGEICKNDSVQIGTGLINGQVYSWSPATGLGATTLSNPVSSPSVTTTYTLTVTSVAAGCAAVKDEVTIIVHPLPKINAGMDDTITVGSSVQLVVTGGIQYNWSPAYGLSNTGIYNPIAGPDTSTTYIVKGTDVFGCVNYDTVRVFVLKPSFWVPTAFTPDGNGHNDVFYIRGEGIKNFEFRVFNRWGEEIFFSKDITQGWDGKRQLGGEDMPQGAYLYNVRGTLTNGTAVNVKNLVNLIR